jgi:hypothetical protein
MAAAHSKGFRVFLAFLVGMAGPSGAQEEAPIPKNIFYAPYSLLADHPSCKDAGQTAFKVTFSAENLTVQLNSGVKQSTKRFAIADGKVPDQVRQCTIKTRRGVEIIENPIECPDDWAEKNDLLDEFGHTSATPRISGEVTACMSLGSFEILDADWELTFAEGIEDWTQKYAEDAVQFWYVNPGAHPAVALRGFPSLIGQKSAPDYLNFPLLSLSVECLQLNADRDAERPVYISANVMFAMKPDNAAGAAGDARFARITGAETGGRVSGPWRCKSDS